MKTIELLKTFGQKLKAKNKRKIKNRGAMKKMIKNKNLTLVSEPIAPEVPHTHEKFGDKRNDEFFWMQNKSDPKVIAHLKRENAYFEKKMQPLTGLKKKLFKEMKSRHLENESSYPYKDGNYEYWIEFKKGLKYARRLRKNIFSNRKEVYFDENLEAKGHDYFSLGSLSFAPDQTTLAYCIDVAGDEIYNFRFRSFSSQPQKNSDSAKSEVLRNCSSYHAWSKDSRYFFYVKLDHKQRPYQVYRHLIGSSPKKDKLIFHEKDPQFFVSIENSLSGEFIYINSGSMITSETWYLRSQEPTEEFRCIQERKEGIEYSIQDRQENFWMLTNAKAQNFKLMIAPIEFNGKRKWTVFQKEVSSNYLESFLILNSYLILSERILGLPQIRIYDLNLKTKKSKLLKFPDEVYNVSLGANPDFYADFIRLQYSSPVTPSSVIDYNLNTLQSSIRKTTQVTGHNAKNYICKRVWVKSHDQVKVPMTLVYKKSLRLDKNTPAYLYGYGSYGSVIPDAFPARRDVFRLIDRGFVYALAHIRGGAEMGRHWYENGKFLKKKNTFKDFIACAEYLIKNKYTNPKKLTIAGGSAGGMLVGACANMRPDLFQNVVAHVPFVDVLTTMLNKDLLLTQIEYKEWGNPEDKKYYHYMKDYSPYDNVTAKNYPNFFVTAGLNDPRVTYWEPMKWVARLRKTKLDKNIILFKTNMGAGHFGVTGRFDHFWETAEEYAFIIGQLGKGPKT